MIHLIEDPPLNFSFPPLISFALTKRLKDDLSLMCGKKITSKTGIFEKGLALFDHFELRKNHQKYHLGSKFLWVT